jgi:hypothetical protein
MIVQGSDPAYSLVHEPNGYELSGAAKLPSLIFALRLRPLHRAQFQSVRDLGYCSQGSGFRFVRQENWSGRKPAIDKKEVFLSGEISLAEVDSALASSVAGLIDRLLSLSSARI